MENRGRRYTTSDGGGLADDRQPAQPQQRIEPHVAPLRQVQLVEGVVEHATNLMHWGHCSHRDGLPLAGQSG